MKKQLVILAILCFSVVFNVFSQVTTPPDFFAGKWEIFVTGSPRGDVRYKTNLIRKDGKLTGELVNMEDEKDIKPLTKVEETPNKLFLFFTSSQVGELSFDLEKVDADNLKGSIMGYTTTASRVKD
jgi:hypothetical protein